MDSMRICSGVRLKGQVQASGSKNSALPILFASLLAEGKHLFHNVPRLRDIESCVELLTHLGCQIQWVGPNSLSVDVRSSGETLAPYDIVRKMRASILVLGPLLARYGKARVSLPGGCAIGTRPINLHLEGLKALNCESRLEEGYVIAETKNLQGGRILFEAPTVGGTENLLMAASLAKGKTIIENAAKEPEIVDLANYLNKMGARIQGAGQSIIEVEGVSELQPAPEHRIIPDRIEVGTLLIAGAITGGDVTVTQCQPTDLEALLSKLADSGFGLSTSESQIRLESPKTWSAVDIITSPHPGFPTDLQAQFMVLMTQAQGTSLITETIFENRFMHVQELVRLNADITPKTRVAVVRGPSLLKGAPVMATDLRASACLVLAGLVAQGETVVNRIYHLDRGYEKLENKLAQLGASISREK